MGPWLAAMLVTFAARTAGAAGVTLKTAIWAARAVTVVKTPFGVTVPLETPVTGFFTFDASVADAAPMDALLGEYPQAGHAAFEADFLGNRVTGSATPFYEVDLDANPSSDTFRVWDGPRPVGHEGGEMAFNGTPRMDIQLFLAVVAGVFQDDHLVDPFPLYQFGFLGDPHTFTLGDDGGEMLMQLDSATEAVCGDPNGGGVTAGDALLVLKAAVGSRDCFPCLCDADGNGTIASTDALEVLRFAVSGSPALACSACLGGVAPG